MKLIPARIMFKAWPRDRLVRLSAVAVSIAKALSIPVSMMVVPALAQDRPAPLNALEKQGVKIVGTFPAPGGLTAWAAYMGQQPIALYATPDGKHVIAGTMLDADGKDISQSALEKKVRQPMRDAIWGRLGQSGWLADGRATAPRIVYVFTDPNCPYCNKFWSDARPWVDSGQVQLRHIIVGILTPTSSAKAAALLGDKNPAQALEAHQRSHAVVTSKALASGLPRPLDDSGMKPLGMIPPAVQAQLDGNEKLMAELGLRATPAVVWKDDSGAVQKLTGIPDGAMSKVLGPR